MKGALIGSSRYGPAGVSAEAGGAHRGGDGGADEGVPRGGQFSPLPGPHSPRHQGAPHHHLPPLPVPPSPGCVHRNRSPTTTTATAAATTATHQPTPLLCAGAGAALQGALPRGRGGPTLAAYVGPFHGGLLLGCDIRCEIRCDSGLVFQLVAGGGSRTMC